jgi:soluble lytic murein transglycosylase-like protein
MTRSAGPLLACALALVSAHVNAQAGATPPAAAHHEADQPAGPIEPQPPAANPPTADDICRTLEQAAAENGVPVEFFARVIWQESRFNARAVSPKGAAGIAQFMPQTASWHGLADPFDPVEALRHSANYLRELRDQFGNLGLAAAAYNAGPGRVGACSQITGRCRVRLGATWQPSPVVQRTNGRRLPRRKTPKRRSRERSPARGWPT